MCPSSPFRYVVKKNGRGKKICKENKIARVKLYIYKTRKNSTTREETCYGRDVWQPNRQNILNSSVGRRGIFLASGPPPLSSTARIIARTGVVYYPPPKSFSTVHIHIYIFNVYDIVSRRRFPVPVRMIYYAVRSCCPENFSP